MAKFELTDEVKQLGVSKFEIKNSELCIYNGKSCTKSKYVSTDRGEIQKSFDNLTAQMIKDGNFGDEKTVQKIIILLTALIAKAAKDRHEKKRSNNNERDKKKEKREFAAYKYSNKGKGLLHEAIILSGKPTFLKYDSKAAEPITSIESIKEDTRDIKPPYPENYPYEPCEFENMNELVDV
jgi:hypothetical protein